MIYKEKEEERNKKKTWRTDREREKESKRERKKKREKERENIWIDEGVGLALGPLAISKNVFAIVLSLSDPPEAPGPAQSCVTARPRVRVLISSLLSG